MEVTKESVMAMKAVMEDGCKKSEYLLQAYAMNVQEFTTMCLNALRKNPGLATTNPKSMKMTILRCAELGLRPDGEQAAIIPRNGLATLSIMVGGLLDQVRRNIPGTAFSYDVIIKGEEYCDRRGLKPDFWHEPNPMRDIQWQTIIAAYCVASMPGSRRDEYVIVYRKDLEKLRGMAAKNSSAWLKWPGQMAIKGAVRRLCRKLPTRGKLMAGAFEDFIPQVALDNEDPPAPPNMDGNLVDPPGAQGPQPVPERPQPQVQQQPVQQQQWQPPEEEAPQQQNWQPPGEEMVDVNDDDLGF